MDRYRAAGDFHRGSAPGPARRLGYAAGGARGAAHPRAAGGDAAHPAPAVGTSAPQRRLARWQAPVACPRRRSWFYRPKEKRAAAPVERTAARSSVTLHKGESTMSRSLSEKKGIEK